MPRKRSPKNSSNNRPIKKSPIGPIEERYPPRPINVAETIREVIDLAILGKSYTPTERQRELIDQAPDSSDRGYLKKTKYKAAS